ncbi:short-chain dehydrogenase [Hypoxylon argillaceum]|nr:short-chain dehydrogenase [Hypoxylon argillaceum]KAI1145487.1 short-chain dehydrogenase [Nemania diffusa]
MSKVIIVTGASRGLGHAIARALLRDSHKVFLVARSADELRRLKAEHGDAVEYMSADLGDLKVAPGIVASTLKAFGRIDGLVLNHSTLSPITKVFDSDAEEWRKAFDVNVFSAVALVKESILELRKSNGRVIFVSSGAASGAYVGWGAYGTSKAALNHLCAHLAVEEPSITAIAVSPGKVDTAMQKQIREEGHAGMAPNIHASFVAEHESGRLLNADQPGTVIAKLAIGATASLTGKHYRWNAAELADFQSK